MIFLQLLAIVSLLVIIVTIAYMYFSIHYRTFLRPAKVRTGVFWAPVLYPEEGEDIALCDLCHGRLGGGKIAACACGKRMHMECALRQDCPGCGNDLEHMFKRKTVVMMCPICLRRSPGGYCEHCKITVPREDGTFKCQACGAVVFASDPVCRKCGKKYLPRITKGFKNKVRSRR